jgi:predicted ATPase/DNA-binding CsgD family transcriptional regulator
LVGRERDLAFLEAELKGDGAGTTRLFSLVGPPGTGKTRLAIGVAERLLDSYEHGVFFVDLSTLKDASHVPAAIAHCLGATYRGHRPTPLEETLKRALRDRHALLVLDNFEGVLDAGALVEDLLGACTRLRVVVTSRAPLRTPSEQQFEVAPLATPNLQALPSLESLCQVEAVELFVGRVQPLRPGWHLKEANARSVAEICVRLDGLPLAIELAASWMDVLTPQDMLTELPHSMNLLDRGSRDRGRHRTLDATIGWSYELLSEDERRLFRRLAVFENGWALDTCLGACADEGAERADTLRLLRSLVDKHLVTRTEDDDGSVRFGFLETIREYALRRLAESGELASIRQRHAVAFLELTERAERDLDSPAQAVWIERLERERGNVRAALEWARSAEEPGAVELGLRIAATLWLFWDVRGHVQEGRQPLRELLQSPQAQRRTIARARALLSEAWLGYVRGDVDEVERVVEEAQSIARELRDPQVAGRALAILGTTLAAYADDVNRTTAILEEALATSRPLGDTWAIGFALYNLGVLAMRSGQLDRATGYLQQCHEVSAATGNAFGIGCSVFRLGWVAGVSGDRTRAVELLKQALQVHWALRNRRVVALCLEQIACLGAGLADVVDLAHLLAVAEGMFEQLPDYTLPPQMVAAHKQGIEAARQSLGERGFGQALTTGRGMSVEQAVHLALGIDATGTTGVQPGGLTGRELQVAYLVADGLTNREIGLRLGLSHHTVDNHLRRIFDKLGVSSRTGVATWFVRTGMAS